MRPRAGVDLDGVVHDWETNTRRLLRNYLGVDVTPSQTYNWIKDECARLGRPDAWSELWSHWVPSMFSGEAYPGATDGVCALAQTHDLVLITRRPRTALGATLRWLTSHDVSPSELVVLHDPSRPKSATPCNWYVDDSPAEVDELATAGKRVYVMDRTWNRELPQRYGVTRVADWPDLLAKVGA